MRTLGMAMAVVLGLATLGRAEPLNLNQVAADSKWVMHIDVDALRASTVMQKAYHKCLEMHQDAEQKMNMVCGMMGMDPRKDLHGVTIYGRDTNKEHGVMIVHADVNQQLLLHLVTMAPHYKATTYGSYELRSWAHKGHKQEMHYVTAVFYKPNIILFAACPEIVKAALDVLDGKSPAITGDGSPLSGRTRPGSIFVARASAIDPNMKCPVLKQTESFRVAMGEYNGESFYRARLTMKSTETVQQIKAIVEGFRALVSLKHGSDPLAMKLIRNLKVTGEGVTLNVRWSASADDVWTAVEKAAKKWPEHMKQRHGGSRCGAKAGSSPAHGHAPKAKPRPLDDDEF
jgi:hypothetical protein